MRSETLLRAGLAGDLLGPGAVTVALSGGADSTALLLALCDYTKTHPGFTLSAAHCNHSLRGGESDRDEAFCADLCRRLGVPFYTEKVEVNALRRRGESLEEAARRLRYDLLDRAAAQFGADRIATAHTANDQAETLLMRLARGAGTDGLAGIPLCRTSGGGVQIIRPLLSATRAEVEAYLTERGESWVEDSSNASDDYARNFVRHELLPRMERLNPRFAAHAAETAADLREENALLDRLAAPLAGEHSAAALAAAPRPLAVRALRMLCAPCVPSRAQTEALLQLCRSSDPSGQVTLGGGSLARRVYDTLIIGPAETPAPPFAFEIGEGETALPALGLLARLTRESAPAKPGRELWISGRYAPPFLLRPRRTGDALTLPGRPRKTLKKLFIEAKVPAAERDRLPALDIGGAAVGVPGFGCGAAVLPAPGETAWHLTLTPLSID